MATIFIATAKQIGEVAVTTAASAIAEEIVSHPDKVVDVAEDITLKAIETVGDGVCSALEAAGDFIDWLSWKL